MPRILAVTGSRAEYGLLFPVLTLMRESPEFELEILATCMHLSERYGSTVREIEADGFPVAERVDMDLADNSDAGIARSMGLGLSGMALAFERRTPDAVMVLGDRFEILAAAAAATALKIPVIHLEGGHLTEGAIDDAFRHAVTKMAHLHFTATEDYRRRIVQMGEQPDRVHAVGSTGLDNFLKEPRIPRAELERDIGFSFGEQSLLVTFHPVTLELERTAGQQVRALFDALDAFPTVQVLFTAPNADAGGEEIARLIRRYVDARPARAKLVVSLGRRRYASALGLVDAVVGNSSSGLIEAPSFGIGTVNIGSRQDGRIRAESIIDCVPEKSAIVDAIRTALAPEFRNRARKVVNPFGDGRAAERILAVLSKTDFAALRRKRFYDIAGAWLSD